MSVETVKPRLAAIAATLEGVQFTYTRIPPSVPAAHLPAVVIMTREATYTKQAVTIWLESRRYDLALLVLAASQGATSDPETLAEPFFARFRDCFTARPGLYLVDSSDALENVQDAYLTGDAGVTDIEIAGIMYGGTVFSIQVEELFSIRAGA